MNYCEIISTNMSQKGFANQLLARMIEDCEYYLTYGNRDAEKLWAKNPREQLEYMHFLNNSFSEYEQRWELMEKLSSFEVKMRVLNLTRTEWIGRWKEYGVWFYIFRKWGDEDCDRYECYICSEGKEKEAEKYAHAGITMNHMDFLLACEANWR